MQIQGVHCPKQAGIPGDPLKMANFQGHLSLKKNSRVYPKMYVLNPPCLEKKCNKPFNKESIYWFQDLY